MKPSRVGAGIVLGLLAASAVGAPFLSARAAQTLPPGPFTQAQAVAGHTAYDAHCAACHRPTLGGSAPGAPVPPRTSSMSPRRPCR